MNRHSLVTWKGSGKEGNGTVSTQSGVLDKVYYAWNTRFEDKKGTNPEELIAAAHAACFTMKLSFLLGGAGFEPDTIATACEVKLENDAISHSHLTVRASVPGISYQQLLECADNANDNCIVSKALRMDITMEVALNEKGLT